MDDRRDAVISANDRYQRDRTEDSETPVPFRDDWSDPDTASIASRDSDDLAARRPNRWRGNPRAWQHITELDRAVVAAMGRTRDRDLAVHLYNAFHMKRTVDVTEPDAWAPKAYWTAWPLRLRDNLGLSVFDDNGGGPGPNTLQPGLGYASGADDIPIFRSNDLRVQNRPSRPLEEMLTATIQRVAREQFHAQRRARQQALPSRPLPDNGTEVPAAKSTTLPTTTPDTDYAPAVVLADDELAAHLLHPSVRHLLAQVDKVLLILHNTRVATAAIGEDNEPALAAARSRRQRSPSVDVGGGTGTGTGMRKIARQLPQPSKKRVCTRPSNWVPGPEWMVATAPTAAVQVHSAVSTDHQGERAQAPARQTAQHKPVSTTKGQPKEADGRGRPAKRRERLPGETEKQFLIRIARQSHRRIPDFSDDDEEDLQKEGEREEQKEKAILPNTPVVANQTKAPRVRQRRVSFADNVKNVDIKPKGIKGFVVDGDGDSDSSDDESDWQTGDEETSHRKRTKAAAKTGRPSDKTMARWPLRDWTDVLGAAALSGEFGPEVLARTAQRCADLFGQSMAMDTLIGVCETLQDVVQHFVDYKKPLSIDRVVYAPGAAGPYPGLATVTGEADTTALDKITLEVQRAHTRRQNRLAQRQVFMEERLQSLEKDAPALTADRGDGGDEGSQDEDTGEESTDDDDSDGGDGDTKIAQTKAVVSRSKSKSASIIPPPAVPASTSTSTAPEAVPKPRFGTQPKPTPTVWYCPRPNCPRSVDGFTRRLNMVRHLKLMHNIVFGTDLRIAAPQPLP